MTDSGMNLFVHIGAPKSGTTTLQENLFADHPNINCLGRPNHRSDEYKKFHAALTGDGLSADAVSKVASFFQSQLAADKVNMLSDETLCMTPHPGVMLERLARACPFAHIVLTIRNQFDAIRSQYMNHGQLLKNAPAPYRGRHVTFADFFAHAMTAFDANRRGDLAAYDYANLYGLCVALFGADQVHVLLFEKMADGDDGFALDLSNMIGIPKQDVVSRLGKAPRNSAVSGRVSTFNKYRSKVPLNVSFSRSLPGGQHLRNALHGYLGKGKKGARHAWTDEQRRSVERAFGTGNRALAEKLGIDLESIGYPMDMATEQAHFAQGLEK